jgi:uncharacterized protein (DUF169 family)
MSATSRITALLGLRHPPIAIGFLSDPPAGVPPWTGPAVAAGCMFWRKAMEGQTFYTVPADHYNCAVGCHTHCISLPPARAEELDATIGYMIEHNYLTMADVPQIPTLSQAPGVIAYGPVDSVGFRADVVAITVTPAQALIVHEALIKARVGDVCTQAMGRPACAVLPLILSSHTAALSLGCKGNRTFTGLPDEEMYICIPAEQWTA